MSAWDWVLLSGIPSSHPGGTGQLMRHLEKEILASGRYDGTIIYCPDEESLNEEQLNLIIDTPRVVIFHPQMLGLLETINLISRRRAQGLITHIYLLDSFFFCRRSYNHIDSETSPCLRCVGAANMSAGDRMGCKPWPKSDGNAMALIEMLQRDVSAGHVHLFAQTQTQETLARQHFGDNAVVDVVGLWCDDWAEHFDRFFEDGTPDTTSGEFDIVYHGSRDMAKGLGWVLTVAAQTPHLSYLVPLDRGPANFAGPPNVKIQPMRWDEGLFDAITGAAITLAPSLWSAPCEGALVKSIVTARATAVVDNSSAFAAEIPDSVCLRLPTDPAQAGQLLSTSIENRWRPNTSDRQRWVSEFLRNGIGLVGRITPESA